MRAPAPSSPPLLACRMLGPRPILLPHAAPPSRSVDAHLLAPADHPARAAEPSRPAAASEPLSPDPAVSLSGANALAPGEGTSAFNVQLAYGSQNPVTELLPSALRRAQHSTHSTPRVAGPGCTSLRGGWA
jgi:hypothetical protein